MSYEYRYLKEHGLVLERLFGTSNAFEFLELKRRELEEGIEGPDLRWICEMREVDFERRVEHITLFTEGMQEIGRRQPNARAAVLAAGQLETAAALLYATNVEEIRSVRVFQTRRAAVKWLGLDEEALVGHEDLIHPDEEVRS